MQLLLHAECGQHAAARLCFVGLLQWSCWLDRQDRQSSPVLTLAKEPLWQRVSNFFSRLRKGWPRNVFAIFPSTFGAETASFFLNSLRMKTVASFTLYSVVRLYVRRQVCALLPLIISDCSSSSYTTRSSRCC